MTIRIKNNQYGKADVKLMKLDRTVHPHRIQDVSLHITLKGDMESAFVDGDNTKVVPTDTMKNTVYVLARRHEFSTIEEFGQILATHFVGNYDQITSAKVQLDQSLWLPLTGDEGPVDNAFHLNKTESGYTEVSFESDQEIIYRSGVKDLTILKSEYSGFENYVQDEYTTLRPTADRVLATTLTAVWLYSEKVDFAKKREQIRHQLLTQFARHRSNSVQQTLYSMGKLVLEANPKVQEITISMPNEHKILADLTKFDLENDNVIFVPTLEPSGIIEATVTRN